MRRATLLFVVLSFALGCSRPATHPVIAEHHYAPVAGVRSTIAVAPFDVDAHFQGSPEPDAPSGREAADLLARFVAEALQAQGQKIVPAGDMLMAFEGQGLVVPRGQPDVIAALAHREFGASGVLLGKVLRYRERLGEAVGSRRPASVGFELTLYDAPGGTRVWSGRFSETQQSLSANVLRARLYPGSGSRWLTAAEFSRWGAEYVASAISALP